MARNIPRICCVPVPVCVCVLRISLSFGVLLCLHIETKFSSQFSEAMKLRIGISQDDDKKRSEIMLKQIQRKTCLMNDANTNDTRSVSVSVNYFFCFLAFPVCTAPITRDSAKLTLLACRTKCKWTSHMLVCVRQCVCVCVGECMLSSCRCVWSISAFIGLHPWVDECISDWW